ncbi:hypothetical protein V5N11_001842 [Cardamine amara subsp. amara]|uniref:RNase H type-1 domain-containing protein n=1 Tax=Cardamine amara subsp. amara TaxID=228776 RepID=A0ABD1BL96_CARAN
MTLATGEMDLFANDATMVQSMIALQSGTKKDRRKNDRKPFPLPDSSTSWKSQTSRIYSKGLVSVEIVKDDDTKLGGFGVSICDTYDNPRLEMNKFLGEEVLEHPQVAELAAIIHGLTWALELGLEKVIFFCDDSDIMDYVTGKAESQEATVSKLLEQVSVLQSRFLYCQAKYVRKDITSVVKLARDVIASQTRFREGDVEVETCGICLHHVELIKSMRCAVASTASVMFA